MRRLIQLVTLVAVCGLLTACGRRSPAGRVTNSLGMEFVNVRAGEFLMGAPDADDLARDDEKPRHRVRISRPFCLAAHEVTVGQFRTFVEETGFKTAAETDGKGASGYDAERRGFEYESEKYSWHHPGYPQGETHPVVNVTWHDAQAFCAWLSKKEGRVYRLPTEAEWEYACRAGTTARFVRGDSPEDLKSIANVADQGLAGRWDTSTVRKYGLDPKVIRFQAWEDGFAFTAPVGSFDPNPLGLYDMLGNVGEFCADGYQRDYYKESPERDPTGPEKKAAGHVVRGGTFLNGTTLIRATSRVECQESYRNYVIGFRVVREVEGGR
jgi:sulfatase modifying factor 1